MMLALIRRSRWLILLVLLLRPVALWPQERPPENPTTALLAEAAAKVDAKKWLDAIEQYQKILDTAGNEIVTLDGQHYQQARWAVHARLAQLPPAALQLYRQRVEAQAAKRIAVVAKQASDEGLLQVLRDMYCCAACEEAILELARRALARGDFDEAESWWRQLLPPMKNAGLHFPQPKTSVSAIRARLILVQLYRQETTDARAALAEFQRDYPDASGLLAGKTGNYSTTLAELIAQPRLTTLQPRPVETNWSQFAGGAARLGTLRAPLPYFWPDQPAWKIPLPFPPADLAVDLPRNTQHPRGLVFHPLLVDGQVLLGDGAKLLSLDARTGQATSTTTPKGGVPTAIPAQQPIRHTLAEAHGIVYQRLGSPELRTGDGVRPSSLVAYGPIIKGERLVHWQLAAPNVADATTHFEGSPTIVDQRLYVGFWRQTGAEAVAGVACYRLGEPTDKPELVWQRVIGKAGSEPHGEVRVRHDLLTVSGTYILACTHSGSVVALERQTGVVAWEYRYPRVEHPITPRYRDLCPVVVDGTRVYVAPADADRLLCLDLGTGRLRWEREAVEVIHLLGVARGRLIATLGGAVKGLRGFNLRTGADRGDAGWTIHDEGGEYSYGRGLVADEVILWPTKHGLHFINPADGTPLRQRLPGKFGNLVYADGFLIVTTPTEVWGYVAEGKQVEQRRRKRAADPNNTATQVAFVRACIDAGQHTEAEDALPATGPHEPALRWWLAEHLMQNGQRPAALRHYQTLATGPSAYHGGAAVRLAQLTDDPSKRRAVWQDVWNTTATVQDELGIPITTKMYAEKQEPSIAPMRGTGLVDDERPIAAVVSGGFTHQDAIVFNNPTMKTLPAHNGGLLLTGTPARYWSAGKTIEFTWTPTAVWAEGRDWSKPIVANNDRIEWWTTRPDQVTCRRTLDLRPTIPRLVPWDRPIFPVASGIEPPNQLKVVNTAPFAFVWNNAYLVSGYTSENDYRVWYSGSPTTAYEGWLRLSELMLHRVSAQLRIMERTSDKVRTERRPYTAKPWTESPLCVNNGVLLPDDASVFLFDAKSKREVARHPLPHPESLAGTLAKATYLERDKTILLQVERNHGVEVDVLEPSQLKRVWQRPPRFLGNTASAVVVQSNQFCVVVDGELRAFAGADGVERWRQPLPLGVAYWNLCPTPGGLVVAPTEALMKNTTFNLGIALREVGWHEPQLQHVLRKSYDVWTDRELPVLVFDPVDGHLLQRLNFPALGPAAGVAWIGERLCVATGHGGWRLQPTKPNE